MMSVRATRLGGKTHDEHVRPEFANDAHDIGQHLLFVPDVQRFAVILGKSEVNGAGKKLAATVEATGGEQFLSAGHAQFLAELGTEHILTAIAAPHRSGFSLIAEPTRRTDHRV